MSVIKDIRSAAIIGARGQMGGLFTRRSREAGMEIREIDRPLDSDKLRAGLDGVDALLVSVPAKALHQVLELVRPHLRPPQILLDNVSVKVWPLSAMLEQYDGPVVGTHPLFGPEPPVQARVAVTPGRGEEAARAVEAWMDRLGFVSFRTTADEHDKAVAYIQGLNFVTTVSYLATLSHQEEVLKFLTPSFERRLVAAKKMMLEDADLFSGLFEANPHGQDAVRRFRNFLHVAAGGDVDLLVQRALWWWRNEALE